MEVLINPQISLLMETADLVCAYVNRSDPATLTSDNPWCIPADEVGRIMERVCGGLDREDRLLQFYFNGYSAVNAWGEPGRLTCVAFKLIYTCLQSCGTDLQQCRAQLVDHVIADGYPFEIVNHLGEAISFVLCNEYRSVAKELKKLDLPEDLRMQLVEVFSNFRHHVNQLCDLLEPVAKKLLPLLEPWWEKMSPRLEQWRSALHKEDSQREVQRRVNVNLDKMQSLHLSLRIFRPWLSKGKYEVPSNILYWSVGLDTLPVSRPQELGKSQRTALRLLSSNDRVEILRAMAGRVMTPKELAQELNMNPGTVFRSLNSLFSEHLVDMVVDGVHRSYTTNAEKLKEVVHDLLRYILKEEP